MAHVESRTNGGQGFMGHVQQMLGTHPGKKSLHPDVLLECIQACFDCAQACIACADACLAEKDPKVMVRCIRLNQDCTNVCETTGKILSRQTAFEPTLARAVLQACVAACKLCGEECAHHADHMEHCRVCEAACKRCEQACAQMLAS